MFCKVLISMLAFTFTQPATQPVKPSFAVAGRVTDAQGRPMPGVTLSASCGMGTLRRTGETTSGPDGRYRLTFGPGMHTRRDDDARWGVGYQAATIFARKAGFFEKNLCRHGNLGMTDAEDGEPLDEWADSMAGTVYAGKEYAGLDFVMLPAARVEGVLVNADGEPMASKSISLDVADESLPPSSSVLDSEQTDEQGRFVFTSVPTGLECWFSMRDVDSEPQTFERAETYRFRVVRSNDGDEPALSAEKQ